MGTSKVLQDRTGYSATRTPAVVYLVVLRFVLAFGHHAFSAVIPASMMRCWHGEPRRMLAMGVCTTIMYALGVAYTDSVCRPCCKTNCGLFLLLVIASILVASLMFALADVASAFHLALLSLCWLSLTLGPIDAVCHRVLEVAVQQKH